MLRALKITHVFQIVATCLLIATRMFPALAQNEHLDSLNRLPINQPRFSETGPEKKMTITGLYLTVASDSWKPDGYTVSTSGLGFGLGVSSLRYISTSTRWAAAWEIGVRKYANQELKYTSSNAYGSWVETIKYSSVKFNFLLRYRFSDTPLRPYLAAGCLLGFGINTGSSSPREEVVGTIHGNSGWILGGGFQIVPGLLLDFRFEPGDGFQVKQVGVVWNTER